MKNLLLSFSILLLVGCTPSKEEDVVTQPAIQEEVRITPQKEEVTAVQKEVGTTQPPVVEKPVPVVKQSGAFVKPTDAELRKKLTNVQYNVTQEDGTEHPYKNIYHDSKKEGIYVDVVSGEPLFSSTDKYDSKTGWPSFTKPLVNENVVEDTDYKLGYPRTEIRSKQADSHLGHLFNDGPEPAGLRYCINSASLNFVPKESLEEMGYGEYLDQF